MKHQWSATELSRAGQGFTIFLYCNIFFERNKEIYLVYFDFTIISFSKFLKSFTNTATHRWTTSDLSHSLTGREINFVMFCVDFRTQRNLLTAFESLSSYFFTSHHQTDNMRHHKPPGGCEKARHLIIFHKRKSKETHMQVGNYTTKLINCCWDWMFDIMPQHVSISSRSAALAWLKNIFWWFAEIFYRRFYCIFIKALLSTLSPLRASSHVCENLFTFSSRNSDNMRN